MKRARSVYLLAAALFALPVNASVIPVCDEICLEEFVDRYLAAVEARDPSKAPLAPRVRFTENTRQMKVGDGFWATATRFGAYRNYFVDVKTQQAGAFAVMSEQGKPGLFTLRLKIDRGLITEAETVVVRGPAMGGLLRTDQTTPLPAWDQVLPRAQRLPREEMIRRVDAYFNGAIRGDGNSVPFAENCERFENGVQTAGGRPPTPGILPLPPPADAFGDVPRGCPEQFNGGFMGNIQEIEPRRYLIVNEEKGLVFGVFLFRHPGTSKAKSRATYPMDMLVTELFKLQNGRIAQIESQMIPLPYRSDTGWDD